MTLSLLYDEPVNKEMEFCNVVDEEDVIVSGHDDKSVGVSGGDNMDMPADNKMLLVESEMQI
ncbi:TIR-NBS-LRR RCT1 resistance protein [Trifolium medium]|uniref:TIR-NBS-LRR RCT1 resistance protein n=1 Tax=Trifolium medium TaxID=97028 RepID=A0A392V105_9FABA|nr:TIR-NBS-LRR RCT1 resistance protein [Trifolium medium]